MVITLSKRRRTSLVMMLAALLCIISNLRGVRAASIFDDDWVPPAPAKKSPVAPPAVEPPPGDVPPSSDVEPAKPDPAVGRPADPLPNVAAPAKPEAAPGRAAIPPRAEQAKVHKLFEEVFAKDLAQRTIAPRRALAAKLLEQAAEPGNAATDRYVLLVGAARAAKDAANLTLYCRAADALAVSYEIDGLRMKIDAAVAMKFRSDSPAAADENCVAGLKLADQLIKGEDFVTASRILSAIRMTPPHGGLVASVQERIKSLEALRAAAGRVAPFLKKLESTPDDAEANLAVGQYLCFDKGDWKTGLPLLARGGAGNLAAAAARDAASGSDSAKYAAVGDAWWSLAETETGARQLAMRRRAVRFYSLAIDGNAVAGLQRTLVQKRIAATPAPVNKDARVVAARWGGGANWSDVTARMNELLANGGPLWANPATLNADPTPGWRKHLQIDFVKYGTPKTVWVDEDQPIPVTEFTP